jgi:hypothetical protein
VRIDDFLPKFDVSELHRIVIDAPPRRVYDALFATDFGRPAVVRVLLGLRGLPGWLLRRGKFERHALTLEVFLRNGFALLSEEAEREIVLGLVGRFWTLTGGLERTDARRFVEEHRPGLAKAAWNFTFEPVSGGTRVTTETRVRCSDRAARIKFRVYWFFVRPFSGLLRRYMLAELRRSTQSKRK